MTMESAPAADRVNLIAIWAMRCRRVPPARWSHSCVWSRACHANATGIRTAVDEGRLRELMSRGKAAGISDVLMTRVEVRDAGGVVRGI